MPDLFEDADEIVSFTDAPSESESQTLTRLGRELFEVETNIQKYEAALDAAKEAKTLLTQKTLPDYMSKVGQDRIGLAEFGVDLVLEDYYFANIKADWPEEQREKGFTYLEDRGDGDLIRCEFLIPFKKDQFALAKWLMDHIRTLALPEEFEGMYIPEAEIQKNIPWNTLTAFVKEQVRAGNEIDLDVLGATVGKVVKIKERKQTKSKGKK